MKMAINLCGPLVNTENSLHIFQLNPHCPLNCHRSGEDCIFPSIWIFFYKFQTIFVLVFIIVQL